MVTDPTNSDGRFFSDLLLTMYVLCMSNNTRHYISVAIRCIICYVFHILYVSLRHTPSNASRALLEIISSSVSFTEAVTRQIKQCGSTKERKRSAYNFLMERHSCIFLFFFFSVVFYRDSFIAQPN